MATGEEGNKTPEGSGETFVVQHLVHSRDRGVVKPFPSQPCHFLSFLFEPGFPINFSLLFSYFLLLLFEPGFLHL